MWKVAICDDESIIRQQLFLYIKNLEREWGEPFSVACFASGEQLLEGMAPDTQILLLDIQMDGLSGMETARKLRQTYPDLCLIFVTTMTQFALEAFDVHAFGFVPKPLLYEPVAKLLREAVGTMRDRAGASLALKGNDQVLVFHTNDILYFEVYGRIVNVVTVTGTKEFQIPLKKVEEQVEGMGFFRCHKSYLVNCRHVKQINPNGLVMSNGAEVTLSKHRRNEFYAVFSRYVRGPL